VDNKNLGTSEERWQDSSRLTQLRPLEFLDARRIVVVAPHPDDEVFGAGGLMRRALREEVEVKIVAVTDGERSHPFLDPSESYELAQRRISESREALRRLGYAKPRIRRLHMPDGKVSQHRLELLGSLTATLREGDWFVAPWRFDGHPDHDVCGEVARIASVATGARLLSYFVWTWHWADPDSENIPWEACRQMQLSRRERACKRWATMAFDSQTSPRDPLSSDEPVLPAPILRRFWRPNEVFVEESEVDDEIN